MTRRDEVVRMAQSAGWDFGWEMTVEQVIEFADLVAAAERERCARIAEAPHWKLAVRHIRADRAAAIRALKDGEE